jgi:hypothetical protein
MGFTGEPRYTGPLANHDGRIAALERRVTALAVTAVSQAAAVPSGLYLGRQTFTGSLGNYSPTPGASAAVWTLVAGGGGGGYAGGTAGTIAAGGGGASGAWAVLPPTQPTACAVAVGAGGPGGSTSVLLNGSQGGSTSISGSFGVYLVPGGTGGSGNAGSSSTAVVGGGVVLVASASLPPGVALGGCNGGLGRAISVGSTLVETQAGEGGASPWGVPGYSTVPLAAGAAGSGYGAGGSGAKNFGAGVNYGGGAGAPGFAFVDEYS